MAKLIIKTGDSELEQIPEEPQQLEEKEEETIFDKKEESPPMQVSLNMRKGLDGRIIIYDHDHIDIVILPEKKKILAFAKKDFSDIIYETQTRLFDFLVDKGLCAPESVQGGNVYASMEAAMLTPKQQEIPIVKLFLLNIKKWIDSEKPSLEMDKKYEKTFTDLLTSPDEEDSTELGEVPQEVNKGSIPSSNVLKYRGGWW